MELATGRR